jgi:hypothetical protein
MKSGKGSSSHLHKTPKGNPAMHHSHLFAGASGSGSGSGNGGGSGHKSGTGAKKGRKPNSSKLGGDAGARAEELRPLSLEQKQQLSDAVGRMEEHKLGRVVDMIKESMPTLVKFHFFLRKPF